MSATTGRGMKPPTQSNPCPVLPHERHEFFLDGVNLGCITLEQAMKTYRAQDVIYNRNDEGEEK